MRNYFIAIIAFVFLSGCGQTPPEGESPSLKSPRPTSITEGEDDKFITAMKQSVARNELSYRSSTSKRTVRSGEINEWTLVDISGYRFPSFGGNVYDFIFEEGKLKLGVAKEKRVFSKHLTPHYALMTEDAILIAWLESDGHPNDDPDRVRLVNQGAKGTYTMRTGGGPIQVNHTTIEPFSLEKRRRLFLDAKLLKRNRVIYARINRDRDAKRDQQEREREAKRVVEKAAHKKMIENFRANAKPLTEKQTVAINLALKTLYKSQNIILEFVQGSLKTEKLLVDIERWTIVALKVGETEPRTVTFDVEVHDSGLLHETVTVSKVRLKYY